MGRSFIHACPELAHAYEVLLDQPHADLAEFAAGLGLDEDAARTVLDRLADMALVEEREEELVALSPILALQHLITREHTIMEQSRRFLQESCQTLAEVMPRYVDHRPVAGVPMEEITDLSSARQRLQELAACARHEVLSLTPVARDPGVAQTATRSLDRTVLARGVPMRTIYSEEIVDDAGASAYARELAEAGGAVRLCPSLPVRMIVVDREFAVVPNDPADGDHGCAVISHGATVIALVALFELHWEAGRDAAAVLAGRDDCSVTERAVLRLLMNGAKDEAVARHLRVSVRTVRRCVADLMTRSGATSRFALGIGAAHRGWL